MAANRIRRIPGVMIVAIVALAAVGTASALPGKGTVDKNDLQRDAVKSKHIRANAVKEKHIKPGAVSEAKIRNAAVSTAKVADAAITTAKLADAAITTAKLADDSVTSAKVAVDSLTAADIAPGVLTVVAFGRVNNPDPGAPTIAPGDVGLTDVLAGMNGLGRTDVLVDSDVLPTGSLSSCSVQATPAATAVATSGTSLGFHTVTVATGSPAPAFIVQVQTRDALGNLGDFDYFIQVTCPNV